MSAPGGQSATHRPTETPIDEDHLDQSRVLSARVWRGPTRLRSVARGLRIQQRLAAARPTQFPYESFAAVTHIWFSHEHPDHFSPPVLKRIPAQHRERITVLFRETRDRRVVEFCRNAGFKVLALEPGRSYELGPAMRILCGAAGSDSWLWAESGTFQLLNMNDCVLGTDQDVERIARQVPHVDVLLTQFSYANWCGNRGDAQAHRAVADGKLVQIARQVRVLKPRWVVPFASFVWFSVGGSRPSDHRGRQRRPGRRATRFATGARRGGHDRAGRPAGGLTGPGESG